MIAAVVPMKPLSLAKQRLSDALPEPKRRALIRTMLCDVLDTLGACHRVAQVFVVTADPDVAALACRHGAGHIPEHEPIGLNGAVALAARHLETVNVDAMLVLPGDVPLVCPPELDDLVSLSQRHALVVVPAHDGDGTNALLLKPPGAIDPLYGPQSCRRHVEAGRKAGLSVATRAFEGLGQDVDSLQDLAFVVARMSGRPEYGALRTVVSRHRSDTGRAVEHECG